jgi:DNA-binding beta-propeller fold protein YncE
MRSFAPPLRTGVPLLTVLLALSLAACSQPAPRWEPDNLVWPPDRPRIKYVQSIYSEDDIGRQYSFREKLFGKDYFDGMVRPYGVNARRNKVVVTDIVMRKVLVFDRTAKRLGAVGSEGGYTLPAAAVTDAAGTLYVADSGGGKVAVYDPSGAFRTSFSLGGGRPVGLAVDDARGRLYVVDRVQHRVVAFDLGGGRLFEFGGRGTDDGKLNFPLAIALDREGRIHILDSGNFRVQIFSPDGAFLSAFGMAGDQPGMFANPKGIAVDSDGHIYVTDAAFSNFQIFDRDGNILLFIGELGSFAGYFHLPGGISIDENDRIYVADQMNSRVQVFQYLRSSVAATIP